MAALSKRDIEMIFRADTEKATRPIGVLGKTVGALTETLKDQAKAATANERSFDTLAATTKELKQVQDELGTARSLLTQLNAQEAALAKAQRRADETAQNYRELSTQVDAAEKPTKRMTNALEAADRAQKNAADNLSRVSVEAKETRDRIEGIIGPVDDFQSSFKQIAETSRDIARGLAVAGQAAEDFKQKIVAAKAAEGSLNADTSFEQAGRSAGLLQAQIDYISQFENRVELLAQAKRELAAQDANFQRSLQAQDAKIGASNLAGITRAFEEAAVAQQRLEQTNAFRDIAAKAAAGARDIGRYGAEADTSAVAVTRLGDAVLRITNPAQAAADTLKTVEQGIVAAEAALNNTSKLRLSAYQDALNEVSRSVAGLQRQAAQVDGLRTQQNAVNAAETSLNKAREEVLRFAQALSTADEPTKEMADALRQAEGAAESAGAAYQREATKLARLSEAAEKAGIDIRRLDEAETQIEATSRRAAKAAEGLSAKLGTGGGGFLGLKPYELQNLGYQVNDVFTSLASGAPPLQVLAQQGGQIAQIFPGLFARMAAYAVPLLALGSAITIVAVALSRTADEAQRLRQYEGTLAALGETNGLDPKKLVEGEKLLRSFGVAADDASKAVVEFAKEGISPDIFDDFLTAAKNASVVLNTDVPKAAELMTKAFTGSKQEVLALANQFPFLSDAEYKQIEAMDESTQKNEIRRIAFDAFYKKMAEGAANMAGPWSDATRALGTAWQGMLDTLSQTGVIDVVVGTITNAIYQLSLLINLTREYNKQLNAAKPKNLAEAFLGVPEERRVTLGGVFDAAKATTDASFSNDPAKRQRTGADADPGAGTTGDRRERGEQAKKDRDQAKKDAKKSASEAEAERKRALAAAKALAKQIESESEQLDNSLDRLTTQALRRSTGSIEKQMQNASEAVGREFAPLQRQLDDFAEKTKGKGLIGGQSIEQYQAQLDANKAIIVASRQAAVQEGAVNDLVEQRRRELQAIAQDREAEVITGEEAAKRNLEVTSRMNEQIAQAAANAISFVSSIAGADVSPELQSLIAKLESIQHTSGAGPRSTINRDAGEKLIAADEQELNRLVSERNNLIAAQNALVEAGLTTRAEADVKIEASYARSKPLIDAQLQTMRDTVQTLRDQGVINETVYNALIAKMDLVGAKTIYVSDNARKLNDLISNQLLAGGSALFDSMGKGLAGLLTGTQSLGQAFGGVLTTFLNFAAQFLQQIAQMIIQALILKAIQSAIGVSGGGGGVGGTIFHEGGVSGGYGGGGVQSRPSIFAPFKYDATKYAIPRYHDGTLGAGLSSDEQLAVLQRGEKVLTEEQQRKEETSKASNTDSAGGIRQVLAFGDEEVAAAMAGRAGEKTVVTILRRNAPLIKQMLS